MADRKIPEEITPKYETTPSSPIHCMSSTTKVLPTWSFRRTDNLPATVPRRYIRINLEIVFVIQKREARKLDLCSFATPALKA